MYDATFTPSSYPHIVRRSDGHLVVENTGYKVRILAADHRALGFDAQQLIRRYPNLTLAQAYAVLTYYHDHKQQIDDEIDQAAAEEERHIRGTRDDQVRFWERLRDRAQENLDRAKTSPDPSAA